MKNFLLERKAIKMSIPEFLAFERGELTLKEIYSSRKKEKFLNNPLFLRFSVSFIASSLFIENIVYATDLSKIDKLGIQLLSIFQTFGYWACIILCLLDIAKSLANEDTKSITKSISKYSIGFSAFYFLPWLFDFIKEILS